MSEDDPKAVNRRQIAKAALAAGAALATDPARAQGEPPPMRMPPMRMPPGPPPGPKFQVAMLVYPGMVLLDLAGPQTILNILGCEIHLVARSRAPVSTDVGVAIAPSATFAEAPRDVDVLFVPGGLMGSIACMGDEATLAFLADRGARARYVTSVCTGGLVLGAAGLLQGYRATAHWGVADLLPILGAIRSHERVVHDRNRLTGGGVTAGLDFGLTLAALLRGQAEAEKIQLILEYAPAPPFHAGSPEQVAPKALAEARAQRAYMDEDARKAAEAAAVRLRRLGATLPTSPAPVRS